MDRICENPPVKLIANAVHISPSYLRRLCWEVRKQSPKSLLRRLHSKMGDAAARKEIPALQPAERAILAEMLLAEAQKKPGETKAFTVLMEMAETDPAIGETLQNTITRMPKEGLAPGLAVLILTRAGKPGDFGLKCQKIVSSLLDGNSPFEKALRQRKR